MKLFLKILFAAIFLSLLGQSIIASLHRDVFTAGAEIWAMPWGRATLMDAYFGFIAFFVYLCYKEQAPLKCALWFVLLMGLGNFIISLYFLIQLFKLRDEEPWHHIFLRRV